jgi:hypothetical protein
VKNSFSFFTCRPKKNSGYLTIPRGMRLVGEMPSGKVSSGHLHTHSNYEINPNPDVHCKDKMLKIWKKYSQKRNIGVSVPISTFICLWANYIFPRWVCLFCWRKYVDRSWEYINHSQTHECGNWGWGRDIPRKGIYKRKCRCSVLVRMYQNYWSMTEEWDCVMNTYWRIWSKSDPTPHKIPITKSTTVSVSPRPNWGPLPSSPASECVPPGTKGGDKLACGWGEGGPNSDDWRKSLILVV